MSEQRESVRHELRVYHPLIASVVREDAPHELPASEDPDHAEVSRYHWLGADDNLVASALLVERPLTAKVKIERFKVEPPYEGRDVGTEVNRAIRRHSRICHARRIWLEVADEGAHFWAKVGYDLASQHRDCAITYLVRHVPDLRDIIAGVDLSDERSNFIGGLYSAMTTRLRVPPGETWRLLARVCDGNEVFLDLPRYAGRRRD